MKRSSKILLCAGIFIIASVYFASKSDAFNTFTSAQDETKSLNESANAIRELRDVDLQILEQLKIMNQNIANISGGVAPAQRQQVPQSNNNTPVPLTPAPYIRANP